MGFLLPVCVNVYVNVCVYVCVQQESIFTATGVKKSEQILEQ